MRAHLPSTQVAGHLRALVAVLGVALVSAALTTGGTVSAVPTTLGTCSSAWPDTVASGRVVKKWNGRPVRGAKVTIYKIPMGTGIWGVDYTNRRGVYRVPDVCDEEIGIRVRGPYRFYERGWLSCRHTLVRTWGAACSHDLGWTWIRIGLAP